MIFPVTLAIGVPRHSRPNPLEDKASHLVDISTKMLLLKRLRATPLSCSKDVLPNENLEKLLRDTQQLATDREKQYQKSDNCWLNKKRELVWTK